MIILIIMGGFFPGKKYGGPPVSVDNFCTLIKDDAECFIVTHNHDKGDDDVYPNIYKGWNDRDNAKVMYLSDKDFNEKSFDNVIKEVHPDFLYLQGLFQECIFPCLRLAKEYGLKVLLAPRGELCSGAFKKKYKKYPYIAILRVLGLFRNVVFQATSSEETVAIKKYLGINEERIHFLNNIPSVPHDLPQRQIKKSGTGKFVFISRIHRKKNLLNAIYFMKSVVGNVVFDIYGPIEDESYWRECEDIIKQMPPNIKVKYRGILVHDNIHDTFHQYDAFLFPTLSENYGHVIVEALLSGCIPIISNQTPWSDINEAKAGWAFPLDQPQLFKQVVQEVVDMDNTTICEKRKDIEYYLDDKLKLCQLKANYLHVFRKPIQMP